MNIIEHLWDHFKRKVRARDPAPKNLDELWAAIVEEWYRIDVATVRRLYSSLPRRALALKKAKGANTNSEGTGFEMNLPPGSKEWGI
ncbi:hypothetical protein GLOTRDRAFT_127261 [Gloeophyllum trabeum ATCC 11539]|uniref:Tc1-like transposase DDE domain-containing protein n=1 Tax=Gloeophyllum trabeum (strain ATCC 11539 / FP-39264 / Madison 617) TaxID=670483 RepID=S7RQL2_GLOTA|nr:uncharacterized protein GLOTRDRAFT_127261 [Gloeophyllum trabeum ATCC 11539]EPQ56870.1 hypothetical protein GLOTRDRAFT_127261 [Gloeophyllum trabeum ATCC 11539]